MPELTVSTGHDTYVLEAEPTNSNFAQARFLKIRSGDELIPLLYMPVNATRIAGKDILTAVLSIPVEANWITQTVTIQALDADWKVTQVNYANKPGVTGPTANSGATGALNPSQRFEIDIASLVQNIADGDPNYGWRLTTSQSTDASQIRSFDSGYDPITLTIEYVDRPEAPTLLSPEGIIGIDKPVLTVDDVDQLAEMQVQIDATPSGTNPDYDSGWVATTRPKLDTSVLLANTLPSSQGNAGTFDTDISGWLTSNCSIARVTTPTQAGAGALRLTATAAADMFSASSSTPANMVPVTAGRTYHVEAYSRAATTTRSTRVEIQWYDSGGASLSTTTGTGATNSNAAWGLREVSAVAPASAAYLRPRGFVTAPGAGEIHYWDTFKVSVGTTNYAGLADGATTFWRARVKLLNGGVSLYSQWAEITRATKPTIVDDVGTNIWDPTPDVTAHLSPAGDADTRWQVIISDVADPSNQRYNSGDDIEGATLDHQIPLTWNGRKVFPADGTYRREIRAWDRTDRVPSQGDLPYVRLVSTVTVAADGTQTAPTTLTAALVSTNGYPDTQLTWTRGADPDWFVVIRDGEVLATVDVDDYRFSAGVWKWIDETAEPNVAHVYYVRAVTVVSGVNKQSNNSPVANFTPTVKGVWLRSSTVSVLLDGEGMDAKKVDKRQSFEMPYRTENVDIITAIGGLAGTYSGVVNRSTAGSVAAIPAVVAQLETWRQAPAALRLVWGVHNIWADIKGLSVVMSPASLLPSNPIYDVSFAFEQIDPTD